MDTFGKEQLFPFPELNFAWPSDDTVLSSLAEYTNTYGAQTILHYYRALRARNFVILAGPADLDKAALARSLAEKVIGPGSPQWYHLQPLPWWVCQAESAAWFAEATVRFNALELFDLIQAASDGATLGLPFFASVEQMSPAEVSCYFQELPQGLIRRNDAVTVQVNLPKNLYITGTMDVEHTEELRLDTAVLRHAAVIRLKGPRASVVRGRRLCLQAGDSQAYAAA